MLLLLASCASLRGSLPTNLEKVDVVEVRVELADPTGSCPGFSVPTTLVAVASDGTEYSTHPNGAQKSVKLKHFELVGDGVRVDPETAWLHIPVNPARTFGATGQVTVTTAYHTAQGSAAVPIRYDCAYTADFAGGSGRNGTDGSFGTTGGDGSSGSESQPGEPGEDGQDGSHGTHGEPGGDADDVLVRVDTLNRPDAEGLLLVVVESQTTDHSARFLVAEGGSVTVDARGGAGGRGGNGGSGGDGGDGGDGGEGAPPGNGGDGGDGGNGGNGADGGGGGSVTVLLDPEAPFNPVQVDTAGGTAGGAGTAGSGGSGGETFSGGNTGRSGRAGKDGASSGRAGQDGPPTKPERQAVELSL